MSEEEGKCSVRTAHTPDFAFPWTKSLHNLEFLVLQCLDLLLIAELRSADTGLGTSYLLEPFLQLPHPGSWTLDLPLDSAVAGVLDPANKPQPLSLPLRRQCRAK